MTKDEEMSDVNGGESSNLAKDVNRMDTDDKEDSEEIEEELKEALDNNTESSSDSEKTPRRGKNLTKAQKRKQEKDSKELDAQKGEDAKKRYKFLLGITDLFAHFIGDKQDLASPTKATKSTGSRRHRKTETEEDAELLQAANKEIPEDRTTFTESPSYIKGGTMREYQVQGLNWMISLYEDGINGILADEMGLGKSLQSISLLGYLKHHRNIPGPHLVIVPKSTLFNWVREFNHWVPDFKVVMLNGTKEERLQLIKDKVNTGDFEVLVTSYEICIIEKAALRKHSWQYVLIDEAHRIKNENSLLSQIVRLFHSRNRLLITGTPLQNNLRELWALLNFLVPDVFDSYDKFDGWFKNQRENEVDVIEKLRKVLQPFMLRRLKSDVEKSLPPKKEIVVPCRLTAMQKKWYKIILEKDLEAINGAISGKRESKTRLLNIVMQLRKCCNHPYLFDGAEPGPPFTTDYHLVENSGKMLVLDKLLKKLKAAGSRVLIFSQMSRVLDILEDYCYWRNYEYCRIDGQTEHEDRVASIDEFNKPDSSKFIFLLTTRAGGLGINLATADIVVLFDSDWNPQADLQAQDRAHRIGQKKPVIVFRFTTEGSIEDKVLERAKAKLQMDKLVIQNGKGTTQNANMNNDELLAMLRHGAQDIMYATNDGGAEEEDIEEVLRRGEEKTAQLNEKFESQNLDDLMNFRLDADMYEWEGQDFTNKTKKPMGIFYIEPSKRNKEKVNYGVDAYYREVLKLPAKETKPRPPKAPKQFVSHDFQFFPKRLAELQHKELCHYYKNTNFKVPVKQAEDGETEEELELRRQNEQKEIDEATPLTEQELEEKEQLLTQGFGDWSRRDFSSFVKACERHGRGRLEEIAKDIEGKTPKEVKTYSKVFWERYQELKDWEKIIENIEKGEQKLVRREEIQGHLTTKVNRYRQPLQQLKIPYSQNKGKNYTEEEDRFLIIQLERLGYGSEEVYDRIRDEIRNSPLFRFDWFIKSRTAVEISRRCNTLISLLEKENHEIEEQEKEEAKKRKQKEKEKDKEKEKKSLKRKSESSKGSAVGRKKVKRQ